MYADMMTDSMKIAIGETNRRRALQERYNEEHGITPQTIRKAVRDLISISKEVAKTEQTLGKDPESMSAEELTGLIEKVEKQMRAAALELNFEMAAELRDRMIELKSNLDDATDGGIRRVKRPSGGSPHYKPTQQNRYKKKGRNRGGKA